MVRALDREILEVYEFDSCLELRIFSELIPSKIAWNSVNVRKRQIMGAFCSAKAYELS